MKILLLVTKGDIGGAQNFVLNLAAGLKTSGQEVTVGFGAGDYLAEALASRDIPYHRFENLRRSFNPFRNLAFVGELKKFLAGRDFDVIHFNSSNALLGALGNKLAKKRARAVFTVHGLSLLDKRHESRGLGRKIYAFVFKSGLKLIDRIVFVSRTDLETARQTGLTGRGEVIYNGLDFTHLNFYEKDEARKILAAKTGTDLSNAYIIGSIGRLSAPKNYAFLINNFPSLLEIRPDAKLVIIGAGPQTGLCRRLIFENSLSDRVFLAGALTEAHRYLKAFDLLILPSIYEGLPFVLIEAKAAGIPVLASNVGGNGEIAGRPEELFRVNDAADLTAKFRAQLSPERTENLENQAASDKSLAEKFSLSAMTEKYLAVYRDETK